MPQLALHIKPNQTKTKKFPEPFIALTYYDAGYWGCIERHLKFRGVTDRWLSSREASTEEMKAESHEYRVEVIHYRSWTALIEDEKIISTDHLIPQAWFDKIEELQEKYPLNTI
jgi:hypothetical protein